MRKVLSIILGVLMIAMGVFCICYPGITFLMVGYFIGISMIFDGVNRIVNFFLLRKAAKVSIWVLISAIISLIFGFIIVGNGALQLAVDRFIVYMAIAWFIMMGVMRIIHAFEKKKNKTDEGSGTHWMVAFIIGVIMILCGIVGFFMPLAVVRTIGTMIGFYIIITGINNIHFGTSTWMA